MGIYWRITRERDWGKGMGRVKRMGWGWDLGRWGSANGGE
jgi:hypothetical protein